MANTALHSMTQKTNPSLADELYLLSDPTGTPADRRILYSDLLNELTTDGYMLNGKISVTVASNNITLALKTKAGNNPSASDPVGVFINGTLRLVTAALSVTVNAGANSFNAGSAELATKEIDYFAYAAYRTASSAVVLGFARIPSARLYSDLSATATNEKYGVFSTAPASGDDCAVIGRFAATLSAGAGYTWTVPTYTSANLIQSPTYETRWLAWAPVYTGFSANPTQTVKYKIRNDVMNIYWVTGGAGTSNATGYTMTLPFTSAQGFFVSCPDIVDNTTHAAAGIAFTVAAGNTLTFNKSALAAWTNTGSKYAEVTPFFYGI